MPGYKIIRNADNLKGNIFIQGAISPEFIAAAIAKHQSKTNIGAHDIFLGQIRSDNINGKTVTAIEYSAHIEMVIQRMQLIRESIFEKYSISCLHVMHSLGMVNAGEICLFVFLSSAHRQECMDACRELVEKIKSELPIWGKEYFSDNNYQWKQNR